MEHEDSPNCLEFFADVVKGKISFYQLEAFEALACTRRTSFRGIEHFLRPLSNLQGKDMHVSLSLKLVIALFDGISRNYQINH